MSSEPMTESRPDPRPRTLRELVADREHVHLPGHPEWDAGYLSAMALVEAYLNREARASHSDVSADLRAALEDYDVVGDPATGTWTLRRKGEPIDSATGLPLGPNEVAVSGGRRQSLDDILERMAAKGVTVGVRPWEEPR